MKGKDALNAPNKRTGRQRGGERKVRGRTLGNTVLLGACHTL